MSRIELFWDDDDQRIMLAQFNKGWTWAEMFDTLRKVKKVTEQRDELVGAIVQMQPGAGVPNGAIFSKETRDKARQMLQMGSEGKGPIAIVGMNGVVKAAAKAFTMLDSSALDDVYFVDTLAEARRALSRHLGLTVEQTA